MSVNAPHEAITPGDSASAASSSRPERPSERGTETKSAFKTTEFVIYLVAVAGVLIASNLVDEAPGRADPFLADKAWLYITVLTVGYLISRGLAKSGTRSH
jgi:hypothetical protein